MTTMSRGLTPEEETLRAKRLERLPMFLEERMPVLADFAERLELPRPTMIVADPHAYVPAVGAFMRDQTISADDRAWILTRLGYLLGELLIQRLGGHWFLNEIPDSRYFLRYVVGRFTRAKNLNAMVDPFEVADQFLRQPPGRDLTALADEVEREIRTCPA